MKHLLLILFFATTAIAQQKDSLDFFPLREGNLWQYIDVPSNNFSEFKVLSVDTLFSDSSILIRTNGPNYKIYLNDVHTIYWNIDTGWAVAYKFDVSVNSNWLSQPSFSRWTVYKRKFKDAYFLFADSIDVREYWITNDTNSTLPLSVDKLARGIGGYYSEYEIGITYLSGCIIDGKQYGTIINVEDEPNLNIPSKFELSSYPNPFNSQTTLFYTIPSESRVNLKIYNILGEVVDILFEGEKSFGQYLQVWDAYKQPSGVYIAVLHADNHVKTTKMICLK